MKKAFIWMLLIWPVFMACKDEKDEPEPPEIVNPDNPNKDEIFTGTTGSLKWEANLTTAGQPHQKLIINCCKSQICLDIPGFSSLSVRGG